jgi:hypothetical protein
VIGRASAATRILTRHEVAALLSLDECIAAVEHAFRLHSEGRALGPGVLGLHAAEGGFHIKAAGLPLARNYFAAKLNANFSGNPARHGLPTIQGVVVLADADTGEMLAVMDSIEITVLRTGAATAVAARRLARADSAVLTVAGCGNQGRVQLRALARVLPIRTVHAVDQDGERASRFAAELGAELAIDMRVAPNLSAAARARSLWKPPSRRDADARRCPAGHLHRGGRRRQRRQTGARAGAVGPGRGRHRCAGAVRDHRRAASRAGGRSDDAVRRPGGPGRRGRGPAAGAHVAGGDHAFRQN